METSSFSFSLLLLILSIVKLSSSATIFNSTTDQDALLTFKNGVASDPYDILSSNWSTNTSICYWTGVSCGLKHRRVTALNLSGYELQGNLAPHLGNLTFLQSLDISHNNFTGSIPSELSNLRRLKAINASFNDLTGEIPSWFGALPQLQRIVLRNNSFSVRIPSGIFTNMSSLIEIDVRFNKLLGQLPNDTCRNTPELRRVCLSGNQLSGQIPASIDNCRKLEDLFLGSNRFIGNIPSEIGNLTMLRKLTIYSNVLEGEIPISIFNISSLEFLDLMDNRLSGSIPAFSNLPKIETLYLHRNKLTGGIPKEIGQLTSLKILVLFTNHLTGHIPKQLGNLTALERLDLSVNKLAGELPKELGNLVYLEELSASFNDFLSGSIPSSIFNLSTLRILSLQQNQFSGTLPPNMGLSLSNLEELHLFYNRLSGKIPSSITNASKLTVLELNKNSFTGSIPDFGSLRLLQTLRLWENNLIGAESPNQELGFLSSLTNCRDLKDLEISNNSMMNGILPASTGNLSSSLITFAASNCNIRGVIPSEIGNLSSLQSLDLSENQITGFIPTTLGKLKQLGVLQLYDNQLHSYIPRDLCLMSNLINLDLSSNMLTGSIPECLGEIQSLREVSLASNMLNSTLPSKFFNLKDLIFLDLSSNYLSGQLPYQIGKLKALNWFSLSSNEFSGYIPDTINGCESLEFLSLSNNVFNGSIPQSLGDVKGLRVLDLSNNNLSGSIPKSLEKLDLKELNASYNKLEGEIPDEGCFAKLNAYSFQNNSALCGATRFQVPPCAQNHGRSSSTSVALEMMKYIVPAFIAVMILVVGVVFLVRRQRPNELPTTTDYSSVGVGWKIVSERELKQGTNSFSELHLLGRGGIGSVFKATLADGTVAAVKVFDLQLEGANKSFETESRILSTIRHRNLVKILGCCSNPEFKALILAYMPNGSLEKWLHSDKYVLDLGKRLSIAMDVALALEYLHHGHTCTVVHCDIKPNNVLIDQDMNAHVGDFGVSKLFDNGEAEVHTRNMATIGYAAPEFGEGKISTSGDVYSFGILLLEMFTSKKPTDDMFSAEMSIKEWVEKALQENKISDIVASGLLSREDQHFSANLEVVQSIFDLAMKCLAVSAEERINMMQVVAALQKIKAKVLVVEEVKKKKHQRR